MSTSTEPRRLRPFVALEFAAVCGGIGNGISAIAFPWIVLELTGNAAIAGVVAAITTIPMIASFFFAGALVDILGRRTMAVGADLLSMISVALVPIVSALVGLNVALVCLLAILGATFDPAGISARESMLPEAAREAKITLERANGINEATWGTAYLVGPGVGGLAIGFLGGPTTFWISAILFALGALTMFLVQIPGALRLPEGERPSGIWRSTREGIAFLWSDRLLRLVVAFSAIVVAFWLPIEGVVFPYYFETRNEPTQLGITLMAIAGGGIVGALAYSAVGQRLSRYVVFVTAMVITGISVVGLALLPPLPWLVAIGFVAGIAYGPVNPIQSIAIQERTPSVLRGRVIGLVISIEFVMGPLGYLIAGPLIQALGVNTAFMIMAIGIFAATVLALCVPRLRGLDEGRAIAQ